MKINEFKNFEKHAKGLTQAINIMSNQINTSIGSWARIFAKCSPKKVKS